MGEGIGLTSMAYFVLIVFSGEGPREVHAHFDLYEDRNQSELLYGTNATYLIRNGSVSPHAMPFQNQVNGATDRTSVAENIAVINAQLSRVGHSSRSGGRRVALESRGRFPRLLRIPCGPRSRLGRDAAACPEHPQLGPGAEDSLSIPNPADLLRRQEWPDLLPHSGQSCLQGILRAAFLYWPLAGV